MGLSHNWALLKRGCYGICHHFSEKHLDRHLNEFAGRHNSRPLDTEDQIADLVMRSVGKRLGYERLIGPKETRSPKLFEMPIHGEQPKQ